MARAKNRTGNVEGFWAVAGRLKREPRRGWTRRLGLTRPESVADHSFAVALLCLFLADRKGGYDTGRLLKLALLHDLDEAITGDFTPEDKRRLGVAAVKRARETARKKILRTLPEARRKEWARLWTDLLEKRSVEAKLVKDVDLMEMALQARDYEKRGAKRADVKEFYESVLGELRDPEMRETVERISRRNRGKG